ncbi:DUF1656 domain-containing protein [Enterobacteriaceae bacterium BIT-l23]|uniref:DUF1656 domain-containing protein n=1 Tax=Jejubacter calystegiae TaxID=2579935 RepID=A0A4P8YJE7_9ENTR|nr:DUF1656 domain-containing protein [Enterobacteriaceae bacterium BIT-l23]QCT20056.1 DUF1656 domain-containing protein [Jejubacter calystegiae]
MRDYILFGMSFPLIFFVIIFGYTAYRIIICLLAITPLWQAIWHRPLFCFALYSLVTTAIYLTAEIIIA